MNTLSAIKTRKSPDAFNTAPIREEDLKIITEAGNYAPIFGKINITLVKNPEVLSLISSTALDMMKHSGNEFLEKTAAIPGYNPLKHCTAFAILSSTDEDDPMGFHMANVSCAAENMILAATDLGIGSRFMMGPMMALTVEPVKSMLAIPDGFQPLIAVALGHVDESFSERTKDMNNIQYI